MIENLLIRPGTEADLPFIYSTWLRSYRFSSQFAKRISNDIYYENHHKLIEHILQRALVLVASESENGPIFGYLVYEPGYFHFSYVKKPFRNLGIFTTLLQASVLNIKDLTFTHLTDSMNKIWEKNPSMHYNPYYV